MKIVCLADLQGQAQSILPEMLPDGDIVIIAGDLTSWGSKKELEEVNDWLASLPYKYKIVVGGNHDNYLMEIDGHELFTNAIYLQDELVEIEGIKIWGSPVNEMNEFRFNSCNAFCDPVYSRQVTKMIPEGLDILITHGPPYGILDQLKREERSVGSRDILDAVRTVKPKYSVFGHIHESHGRQRKYGINFINASICSESNQMFRDEELYFEPIIINMKNRTDKNKQKRV